MMQVSSNILQAAEGAKLVGRRYWLPVIAIALLGACALISFWPALSAPVTADDRYWYIETPVKFDGSYLEVVFGTLSEAPDAIAAGELIRLSTLGRLARRLVGLAIFDLSRSTSASLVLFQGLSKLLLLLGCVLTCLAFVRVLRWRSREDRLIALGRGSLVVVAAGLVGLLAAGVQTHQPFRNAWISYSAHTYLTVIIVFGSAAATVALARRIANNKRGAVPLGLVVALLMAVVLNWTYELNYLGFPLSLFALWVFPLTERNSDHRELRARLIFGGTFAVSWLAIFAWTRVLIAGACEGESCYVGTTPSLGSAVFRTIWYNVASSVPGSSRTQFLSDLQSLEASHLWTQGFPWPLLIVSVGLGISVWFLSRWASVRWPRDPETRRAEGRLLGLAGLGAIGVGLGGATIMSLSVQAQELINEIGLPYRHTVLTWASLSLAAVSLVRALELLKSRRIGLISVTLLAVGVALASAFTLPRNVVSTQAHNDSPSSRALADIYQEIFAGDLEPPADQRRCQKLEHAESAVRGASMKRHLGPAADEVFRMMYGLPFCSTWANNFAAEAAMRFRQGDPPLSPRLPVLLDLA